ncbi:MAG: LacI family DNA-binding transcriptional regulator [Planctomycetota bacterium]
MPTVREIAREAGVSAATVSRVLNSNPQVSDETRQRVLNVTSPDAIPPRGSRPARRTKTLGLMYTGEASIGSPFDQIMLAGIGGAIEEAGYDLLVINPKAQKAEGETYTQMLRRRGVSGVLVRTNVRTKNICKTIAHEGFPMVVIGERFEENDGVRFVYSDSRSTSREAVRHLIELGHRRIAVVMNVTDDSDHLDRIEGWREAHRDHGIDADPRLILRAPAVREGGVQTMKRLTAMANPPTAIFITDPFTAVGAMNQALAMGVRIPEDLAVVGFDDGDYRYSVYPQMTAVCQHTFELGREAVSMLVQAISTSVKTDTQGRCLPSWLEVHDSTAAATTPDTDPQ